MTTFEAAISAHHRLVLDDRFDGIELDRAVWIPSYLPHWAGSERSAARYRLDGRLLLEIDVDQPAWAPHLTGPLRVSSLQTGACSGPVGSTIGQHRTHPAAVVVEQQPPTWLHTPRYGAFELQASWRAQPGRMIALWMIGIEDEPSRSAEICIMEIFGVDVAPSHATIGMGLHPFGDASIVDDFERVTVAIDVSQRHAYGAVWEPGAVTFYVDGQPVKRSAQAPDYPMQFMLDIWDFGDAPEPTGEPFVVERFRSWERVPVSP